MISAKKRLRLMACIGLRRFLFKPLLGIAFLTGGARVRFHNSEIVRAAVFGDDGKGVDSRIGFFDHHGSDQGTVALHLLRVFSAFFQEQFFVGLGEEFG